MSYKTNCKMYAEEYIGNPGKVPVCDWTGKIEPDCDNCSGPKQTNADRIRQMTDEELARWIASDLIEPGYDTYEKTYQIWLSWLKSPVEKEDLA